MKKCRFVVPGKPVGYVATTRKSKWTPEYQKYAEYAAKVRECADKAGMSLPLFADKEHPLIIKTIAYFQNGVHCDPGNVQKGVCDALFYDEMAKLIGKRRTGKGNDKYTGGSFPPPRYDEENPHVVVIVKPYLEPTDDLRNSERNGEGRGGEDREDDGGSKGEAEEGASGRKPRKAVRNRKATRRKKARS